MDLIGVLGADIDRSKDARAEFMRDEEARSRALFVLMMLDFKKDNYISRLVDWDLYRRSRKCEVFKALMQQAGVEIYANTEGYLRERDTVYRIRFAQQSS